MTTLEEGSVDLRSGALALQTLAASERELRMRVAQLEVRNAELEARNADIEADKRIYQEMAHAALDALHASQLRWQRLRQRCLRLLDLLKRFREGRLRLREVQP